MIDISRAKTLWPPTCHGRWMNEEYVPGLVSVIIPTYNRAHMVTEAMDSVWAQAYRPIELIVVDDGSTDDTARVLEDWRAGRSGDARFELCTFRQQNRGAPAARNLGLIESRGEFIQYLDSDDLLGPRKLEVQVAVLVARPSCAYAYGYAALFRSTPEARAVPTSGWPSRGRLAEEVARGSLWVVHSGVYRRRACVQTGPWDESIELWQDWEYALRFAALDPDVAHIPRVLSFQRLHRSERISARSRQDSGPQRGAHTLARMESQLGRLAQHSAGFRCTFAAAYLRMLRGAMEHGSATWIRYFADQVVRRKPCAVCRLRLAGALAAYSFLGGRTAGMLLAGVQKLVSRTHMVRRAIAWAVGQPIGRRQVGRWHTI